MVNIGELARLAGVSVRMLRHYDQLGLLRPHRVDPHTGYRSSTAAQWFLSLSKDWIAPTTWWR